MQTVTFEDITRDLSSLAMVDVLENLATVCESSVVDLGWRIDEELLYVSSFYREDSVFGSPVASQLSRDALTGSMATALRFLMSRGEAAIADSGDVILRGSINFVAEFLTKVTRQATIEARSDGLRRCLALRRAGDLCLIDEVLPDGRHHLLLLSPQAEATFAASVIAHGCNWSSAGLPRTSGKSDDAVLALRVENALSGSKTTSVISRVTLDHVATQGGHPEFLATFFAGDSGLQVFRTGTQSASLSNVFADDVEPLLEEILA